MSWEDLILFESGHQPTWTYLLLHADSFVWKVSFLGFLPWCNLHFLYKRTKTKTTNKWWRSERGHLNLLWHCPLYATASDVNSWRQARFLSWHSDRYVLPSLPHTARWYWWSLSNIFCEIERTQQQQPTKKKKTVNLGKIARKICKFFYSDRLADAHTSGTSTGGYGISCP